MARISNTKGIKEIGGSQFELIIAAANRARSYSADNPPLAEHFNKRGMTALREIEAVSYTHLTLPTIYSV